MSSAIKLHRKILVASSLILIIVILFFPSTSTVAKDCHSDTSICAFYCKANEQLNCETSNYLMSFGYKYCQRFLEKDEIFRPHTRHVLSKIRTCLVQKLATAESLTCENAAPVAIQSHVDCYVNNGFCDIQFRDRLVIFWEIKSELPDPEFQASMRQILRKCSEN
jgi:hypothetical protein